MPVSFFIERKLYSEILYNLFQNAIKFNKPNGSVTVNVRFEKETGKMVTTIEDTGVGIPQNLKRNLFIAFRNATSVKKHEALSNSGIGIGLSNSKCLVNALAGKIDLQSKLDKGTIVTFEVDIVVPSEKKVMDKQAVMSQAIESGLGSAKSKKMVTEGDEQLNPDDFAPKNSSLLIEPTVNLMSQEAA